MNRLQPLSKIDELALLVLVRYQGLDETRLACRMTRQQGHGEGVTRRGRPFDISYDLELCEYCGNVLPSAVCPAKAKALIERALATEPPEERKLLQS
jgi:hypothetical protein